MELWTVEYSDMLYQEAKDFFLKEGRSDFLLKKPLSLCGRYCITQKMRAFGFIDFIAEDGVYQCGEYTFALSYSVDTLFFALDTERVVVDVEKIRDKEELFYLQRCGKECLVKWLDLPLDEYEQMEVHFAEPVCVVYQGKQYPVEVWTEKGYVYAVMKKMIGTIG